MMSSRKTQLNLYNSFVIYDEANGGKAEPPMERDVDDALAPFIKSETIAMIFLFWFFSYFWESVGQL